MKKYFLLQILVILICASCATTKNNSTSFHIERIDSIRSYYLIYASKAGNVYKIFSKKDKKENYTQKIKEGGNYKFNLSAYFGRDAEYSPVNYQDVKCVFLPDSVTLCIENGCLPNLYRSDDIRGLYIK